MYFLLIKFQGTTPEAQGSARQRLPRLTRAQQAKTHCLDTSLLLSVETQDARFIALHGVERTW